MTTQSGFSDIQKKRRGRPKGKAAPPTVMVRMRVETLAAVDAWAAAQSPPIQRVEALDRLIAIARRGDD